MFGDLMGWLTLVPWPVASFAIVYSTSVIPSLSILVASVDELEEDPSLKIHGMRIFSF